MKKKKAYTLLEMLIVISIIIIILGITMRFGGSHIDNLKEQIYKEDFKNTYNEILIQNISSNYYNEQRYEKITFYFSKGENGFNYKIINTITNQQKTGFYNKDISIKKIIADDKEKNTINITIIPYTRGCTISTNEEIYTKGEIQIETKKKSEYCFNIENTKGIMEDTYCK